MYQAIKAVYGCFKENKSPQLVPRSQSEPQVSGLKRHVTPLPAPRNTNVSISSTESGQHTRKCSRTSNTSDASPAIMLPRPPSTG